MSAASMPSAPLSTFCHSTHSRSTSCRGSKGAIGCHNQIYRSIILSHWHFFHHLCPKCQRHCKPAGCNDVADAATVAQTISH